MQKISIKCQTTMAPYLGSPDEAAGGEKLQLRQIECSGTPYEVRTERVATEINILTTDRLDSNMVEKRSLKSEARSPEVSP